MPRVNESGNRHRLLLVVVAGLVLAVLAGGVALRPSGRLADPAAAGQADPTRLVPATLTSVRTVPCQDAEPGLPGSTCIKVRARPDGGEEVEFDTTDPTGDTFRAGGSCSQVLARGHCIVTAVSSPRSRMPTS